MTADKSKYGKKHQIARRRTAAAIAGGRVPCVLCGEVITVGQKWALRKTGDVVHVRCGFVAGGLGPSAPEREW